MTPSTLSRVEIPLTTITFPEIALRVRDGHKLRGFFGTVFKEHSELLHNHFEDGRSQYRYSMVQYKVLNRVPTLVGMGEAAGLLVELFLKMRTLDIDNHTYPIQSKHISHRQAIMGMSDDLHTYRFDTLWLGLNQKNYLIYRQATEEEQQVLLKRTLTANILTLFEAAGLIVPPEQRVMVKLKVTEPIITQLKNNKLLGFGGTFTSNVLLPEQLGLGKSVSRGFGSISLLR
jgi:hypothetical protein